MYGQAERGGGELISCLHSSTKKLFSSATVTLVRYKSASKSCWEMHWVGGIPPMGTRAQLPFLDHHAILEALLLGCTGGKNQLCLPLHSAFVVAGSFLLLVVVILICLFLC